jgi:hypothetical protein
VCNTTDKIPEVELVWQWKWIGGYLVKVELPKPKDDEQIEVKIVVYKPANLWVADVYLKIGDHSGRVFFGKCKTTKSEAFAEAANYISQSEFCDYLEP